MSKKDSAFDRYVVELLSSFIQNVFNNFQTQRNPSFNKVQYVSSLFFFSFFIITSKETSADKLLDDITRENYIQKQNKVSIRSVLSIMFEVYGCDVCAV